MTKYNDREEIGQIIENEGLGYFIMDYTGPESMPDEEMKNAFIKAKKSLEDFVQLLPENYRQI